MSETAFRELESQVKALSLGELLKLQKTFGKILKDKKIKEKQKKGLELLDSIVGSVPGNLSLEEAKQEYFEGKP